MKRIRNKPLREWTGREPRGLNTGNDDEAWCYTDRESLTVVARHHTGISVQVHVPMTTVRRAVEIADE